MIPLTSYRLGADNPLFGLFLKDNSNAKYWEVIFRVIVDNFAP